MPDVLDDTPVVVSVSDLSAGQWSHPHPTDRVAMPQNAATELLDIDIDVPGKRKKRKGYSLIADDLGSNRFDALAGFFPAGGTRVLVGEVNGTVYTWDGAAGTWSSSKTGLTAASDFSDLIVAENKLFRIIPGSNAWSFDGTSWTDEGNTNADFPQTKRALWLSVQNMLAWGNSATPNILFVSNNGDPQTWDRSGQQFKIGKNDGDGILDALELTEHEVAVMTKDALQILNVSNSTIANWTRQKVADIGTESYRTLRSFGDDALFLSRDGVRSVLQTAQSKKRGASLPLSAPIHDWIERINWQYAYLSVAWVWGDKYYLSVPIDTAQVNSHTLVLSRRALEASGGVGGWTIYRNCNFNAFAEQSFSSIPRLYTGEAQADSKAYLFRSADPTEEATNDNGTAIVYSETSRRSDFGFRRNDKTPQDIEIEAISQSDGTIVVELSIDGQGFSSVGSFSQVNNLLTLPFTLPATLVGSSLLREGFDLLDFGRGRDIQYRITESTLDAPCEILNVTLNAFIENMELDNEGA